MRRFVIAVVAVLAFAAPASASAMDITDLYAEPGPTYLRADYASLALTAPLHQVLGDRWVSPWIVTDPGRFEIGLAPGADADAVRALVDSSGYGDVVDLVDVPYTEAELVAGQERASDVLEPLFTAGRVLMGLSLGEDRKPAVAIFVVRDLTADEEASIAAAVQAAQVSVAIVHTPYASLYVMPDRAASQTRPKAKAKAKRTKRHAARRHRHHRR